jgi:nucleotide-binding universal stress UspA family protein
MKYAALVCKTFGADLTLLHVFEMPAYALPPPGSTSIEAASVEESIKQLCAELEQRLATAKQALDTGGRPVVTKLLDGQPYRTIVDTAEEMKVDLIVMGTQGRTGMQRILVGSVAERVVRFAPCPVLTVPKPKS